MNTDRFATVAYGLALLGILLLPSAGAALAQEDVLNPEVRYDVLRHQLSMAIRAKKPRETIDIIAKLRKSPLGISGEILFYEGHAYYQLKEWTNAYRSLVAYLNTVGRKGRNYKVAIGLFVEAERAIKSRKRESEASARAERSWSLAASAYDRLKPQRDAWREKVVTFGGPRNDSAWVMARRADGGFLVGGTFEQKADKKTRQKASRSMGLMALTKSGRMAWNRIPLGPAEDGAIKSLTALPDDGFLIGGIHRGFQIAARMDRNAVPIRNHDGKPWVSPLAKAKDGSIAEVVRLANGDVLAIGSERVTKDGKSPRLPFVVRLSKDGKPLGKTVFTGDAARFWHDITAAVRMEGGDILAVGTTRPQAAWDTRSGLGYLLRVTEDAKMVWARRVPARGQGEIQFSGVARAKDGGLLAVGQEGKRLLLFKASAAGEEEWRKTLAYRSPMPAGAGDLCAVSDLIPQLKKSSKFLDRPLPTADRIAAVRGLACPQGAPLASATGIIRHQDGFLVLGLQAPGPGEKVDIRLIALDHAGTIQWDKVYGHDGFDIATSALPTEDGGAIIAGATDSIGAGGRDILIFKVDKDGNFANWSALGPPAGPKPATAGKSPAETAVPSSPKPKPGAAATPEEGKPKDTDAKQAAPLAPEAEAEAVATPEEGKPEDTDAKQAAPSAPEAEAEAVATPEEGKPEDTDAKQAGSGAPPRPEPEARAEPEAETEDDGAPKPDAPEASASPKAVIEDPEATPAAEDPGTPKKADAGAGDESLGTPKTQGQGASPPGASQNSDEPPATSFRSIFGSIFGGSEEEKSAPTDQSGDGDKTPPASGETE